MKIEKYSVLMSVYYKEKPSNLKVAIESMLNQTILTDDFVIVKDGKLTKELNEVIREYVNKYPGLFHIVALKENRGLGIALSIGIKKCKNEWIARMDSDDYSVPQRCQKQLEIVNSRKRIDIIGSNIIEFEDEITNVIAHRNLPIRNAQIYEYAKRRNPFGHPSVMIKKSKVLDSGNYRDCYLAEDYDLWLRMMQNNAKCYNIDEYLVYMRVGSDFYKRRGGLKYLINILKFKWRQYRIGFFSFKDYFVSSIAHIVMCLLPNKIRAFLYKKVLRN